MYGQGCLRFTVYVCECVHSLEYMSCQCVCVRVCVCIFVWLQPSSRLTCAVQPRGPKGFCSLSANPNKSSGWARMRNVCAVGHRRNGSTRMSVEGGGFSVFVRLCMCVCVQVCKRHRKALCFVLAFSCICGYCTRVCLPACSSVFSSCAWVEALCQLAGASWWAGYSYSPTYLIAMYSHREMINSPLLEHIQSAPESYTRELKRKKTHVSTSTHTHTGTYTIATLLFLSLYIYVIFLPVFIHLLHVFVWV